MKNLITVIIIAITIASCSANADTKTSLVQNDNYVIILDLSDRLIQNPNQVNIDTSAIRAVFEKFEKSVQKNLVIKSRDKFSIRIIPQPTSSLPANTFENALSIDMSKYSAAVRLKELNKFKDNLSAQLALLYQQSFLGNKSNNFSGVDIWQYFNEQINTDLDNKYNNKVVILTDGYFDFEDKTHGIKNGKLSTTTNTIVQQMKLLSWEEEADKKCIGLMPVKINTQASWLVCGIQSKNDKDLEEVKKLSYIWKKWLKNSGATNVLEPIANSSSEKIKTLILNNL